MLIRLINRLFFYTALLLTVLVCNIVYAAPGIDVLIVSDPKNGTHRKIVQSMHQRLQSMEMDTANIVTISQNNIDNYFITESKNIDLIIPIGTEATLKVLSLKSNKLTLSVAIPRLSYDKLYSQYTKENKNDSYNSISALYLDQPVTRKFDLIQEILPNVKHVGLVLGSIPQNYKKTLKNEVQREVKNRNLILYSDQVHEESEIISTFDRVLEKSDVLLGHIDPLVLNRASARNILLAAYRWRVPVIGISPAYVRAGALASVYTTPSQIGQQLAESIETFSKNGGNKLPKPQYSKYYAIAVNYKVAESMGIFIDSEKNIKNKLSRKWNMEQ